MNQPNRIIQLLIAIVLTAALVEACDSHAYLGSLSQRTVLDQPTTGADGVMYDEGKRWWNDWFNGRVGSGDRCDRWETILSETVNILKLNKQLLENGDRTECQLRETLEEERDNFYQWLGEIEAEMCPMPTEIVDQFHQIEAEILELINSGSGCGDSEVMLGAVRSAAHNVA